MTQANEVRHANEVEVSIATGASKSKLRGPAVRSPADFVCLETERNASSPAAKAGLLLSFNGSYSQGDGSRGGEPKDRQFVAEIFLGREVLARLVAYALEDGLVHLRAE